MPECANPKDVAKEVGSFARDAGYVMIGLGVLGLQRAQVRRRQLVNRLGDADTAARMAELRAELARMADQIDQLVEQFVTTTIEPLEEQLPAPARDLSTRTRAQADRARSRLREVLTAS
ncbi:MAG TPA: hypothetical protein VK277_07670 [Acidimicrobiales bacterium]|nr:hypothetical protein [Acidimicrobiales bacterium]